MATEQAAFGPSSTSPVPATRGTATVTHKWPRELKAYGALVACFFLMFNSWGVVNAYGTFQAYYLGNLLSSADSLKANVIGSLQCFIVLGMSTVMGVLLDTRLHRMVLGIGTILLSAGMFGLGPASKHGYSAVVAVQGVLVPLGMSCFFVASSQIASTWFAEVRTFAVGLVACGASISGLIFPIMIRYTIPILGFQNTVFAVAGVICATSLFAWACAVPKPMSRESEPPSTVAEKLHEDWSNLRSKNHIRDWIDTHAYHNSAWRWATASVAVMFLGFYCIFFNLEEWAANKQVATKGQLGGDYPVAQTSVNAISTAYLLAIMNASSTIGRLGGGTFGQKYGAVLVHASVMFVAAVLCLCFWPFITNSIGAILFVVFFGAFSGAVIGMPPASIMWILNRDSEADSNRVGQWVGMMYSVAAIPSLIGPIVVGALIRKTGGYLVLQMWAGTCLCLASIFMFVAWWVGKTAEEKEIFRSRTRSLASISSSTTRFEERESKHTSNLTSRRPSQSDLEAGPLDEKEGIPAEVVQP